MTFQLLLSFFLLTYNTGFSAEMSVFVQTGDSVQLDLQKQPQPEFDDLYWKMNYTTNIVKYTRENKNTRLYYNKNKVNFNNKTFSLTLTNMQKNESGIYTARVITAVDKDIVTYSVSVIDAVKAPVLTVKSIMFSSDSCTVNFTCRAQDLIIYSSYKNNTCSQEEMTSQRINTLILSCSEELIMCNYSNPFSWIEHKKEIKLLCVENNGTQDVSDTVYAQVKGQEMQDNNDAHTYDVPERLQTQRKLQTQEKMEVNNPTTTYCTVGQHQKPTNPIETTSDHTIYSSVCKQTPKKQTAMSSDEA
ncbi:CD48 antigen-like [Danio aesculapii]|uniref:CD48 antigen-like n=1 Tax=Danio aesculapii TaxID=1142201 RepID=UPI0024BF4522|nr:CD48 antigen-like [Danio aesculapii]